MAVRRIIKVGPRPFIAFSIMLVLLLVLPLVIGIRTHNWATATQFAAVFIGLVAVMCLIVARNKLVVTDEGIAYRFGIGPIRAVNFRDIAASVPVVLAEPDWPITLAIYDNVSEWPALWVPLKPWRHEDVTWLLSIPELKIQAPTRGLTKQSRRPLDDQAR
jgi:hypothetical protein